MTTAATSASANHVQPPAQTTTPRWTFEAARQLFDMPFADLIFRAQTIHRQHFDANEVQMSTLLSIKTGGCAENCGYCSQSSHFETGLKASKLMAMEEVKSAASRAKAGGATRFCMGAAWREPKDRDIDTLCEMVHEVKAMGMETCMTLGMLTKSQAERLAGAGLDYYNHNVDTGPEYYEKVVTTRTLTDRLETLQHVREAGMSVCCGGIIGMGEARDDRIGMLLLLANMETQPESVPINALVPIRGTPLGNSHAVEGIEFVRTIAAARIMMPTSMVRLSAGRETMSEEVQALCFLAGANSIFIGDRLLTTANPAKERDDRLWAKLGIRAMPA
jgi:biotin synthase